MSGRPRVSPNRDNCACNQDQCAIKRAPHHRYLEHRIPRPAFVAETIIDSGWFDSAAREGNYVITRYAAIRGRHRHG